MLPTLARKAASRPSSLLRRRLRHAGLDEKRKRWLARNLGGKIGQIRPESLRPCTHPVTSASGFELLCSYSWRVEPRKKPKTQPKTQPKADPGRRSVGPQIYVPGEQSIQSRRRPPDHLPSQGLIASSRAQGRRPWSSRTSYRSLSRGGARPSTTGTQT